MKRGVPRKYRHIWGYHGRWDETKIGKGLWKIRFKATKGKRGSAMGGLGKGTKIKWRITAVQYAKKLGRGKYQTMMVGWKKLIKIKPRKRVKYKRRKY